MASAGATPGGGAPPPAGSPGSVYSPLPYSDTESSSEEEVFSKHRHVVHIREQTAAGERVLYNRKPAVAAAPVLTHHHTNGVVVGTSATPASTMSDYRPLSNSETSLNGFGDRARLVLLPTSPPASQDSGKVESTPPREEKRMGWSAMSPLRRACFLGSLLLCVLTVVGFLWLLPCDLESTCPERTLPALDHAHLATAGSWEALLPGIEITGSPNLAQGHLVLTVRGPQPLVRSLTPGEPPWARLGYGPFQPDRASGGQAGGGVLALWPETGALAWARVTPGASPRAAACDLIDVTGDGRHDCLLANPYWLVAALDPASGELLWFLHVHGENSTVQSRNSSRRPASLLQAQQQSQRRPARVRFPPLKVRDLDGDGVPDLCALCSPQTGSSLDSFVLISGRRGSVIGRLVNVSGCVSLMGLELEEVDGTLAFTCVNQAGAESVRMMGVQELYLRAMNRSQQDPALLPPLHKRQQPPREPVVEQSWGDGRTYTLVVRGHKLSVENRGSCPRCKALVALWDSRNNTLWSTRFLGEKAMAPVPLRFTGNTPHRGLAAGTTAALSGFVVKFWQWPSTPSSRDKQRRAAPYQQTWSNDHAGVEEGLGGGAPQVLVSRLKERVLLITFNDTDLHVINASQSDVVQLCAAPPRSQRLPGKESLCQPELPAQQSSLLLADLDEDGTQELVSFTSTYVPVQEPPEVSPAGSADRPPPPTTWELVSRVKVIHLEQELPKLA